MPGTEAAPASGAASAPGPAPSPIDLVHYEFALDLPDTGSEIVGRAEIDVRRLPGADTLVLDLLDLTVDSVRVDDLRVPAGRSASTITIPLTRGTTTSRVAVAYHGAVRDGLIVRTDGSGRWTGFGDNWPNRARHWLPSVDHPSDKATVTWIVTAPAGRLVVANGALVERAPIAGGRMRTTWRETHPIPVYAMVIAAAPLVEYDLGATACGFGAKGGCVAQQVYTAPEIRPTMPGAFTAAGEIVRWMSKLIGPFPYEKLAHLQSSTRFGGMENATAIFYSDNAFRRRGVGESLIAHETAHQWFGDAVTEREWSHLWLSEGFATYFAALFAGHAHGEAAFRSALARVRANVLEDTTAVVLRPVLDTAQTNLLALLNSNSYDKGGFVLHMLRRTVGDSAFFRALRDYYAAHRDSTALTSDLRSAMERASGKELGWFFDQWLTRPGYAEPVVTWSYDASSQQVMLAVEQRGRFGPYRFPLTVAVVNAGGRRSVEVEVPAQPLARITIPAPGGAPSSVAIDPDGDLLAHVVVHRQP